MNTRKIVKLKPSLKALLMKQILYIWLIIVSSILAKSEILDQSGNLSVCEGDRIELYVNASGTISSYEWFKDQRPIDNNNPSLAIEYSKTNDAGLYRCIVNLETMNGTQKIPSDIMLVNVNKPTEIVEIRRTVKFDGDEQTWTFHADVHDTDLKDNIFRWEFASNIGDINEIIGYSGINSNYLTIRFKPKDNNFNYLRELRFIADGDCGKDTAYTRVETFNFELIDLNQNITVCEGEDIELNYKIDYQLPEDFFQNPIECVLNSEKGDQEKISLYLNPNKNSDTITFSRNINRANAGDFHLSISHEDYNIATESDRTSISYYPDIIVTNRSGEPFSIRVGQPIKLRIWAEGSIAQYIWAKAPNDTLKVSDDPFYEVLASRPDDAGDYWCTMKSKCGDTTLYFTVKFKDLDESKSEAISLSISEIRSFKESVNWIFYDATGREVPLNMISRGLYFIKRDDTYQSIFVQD